MPNHNVQKTVNKTLQLHSGCRSYPSTYKHSYVYDYQVGSNSGKVDGKLKLRENAFTRNKYSWEVLQPFVTTSRNYTQCPTEQLESWTGVNTSYNYSTLALTGVDRQALVDLVASRFYSDLASVKVNAAEFLATRKKTVDMIANTAVRLSQLYRALRRGRNPFTGRNCNGNKAAQLWLEHTYGWVPLLGDVHTAMSGQLSEPPPFHLRKSRTQSVQHQIVASRSTHEVTQIVTGNHRVTIKADVHVDDPSVSFANSLGLTNPALLAWELLPYSFVVDWFLPIGPWLESVMALKGLHLSNKSTTIGTVTRVFVDARGVGSRTGFGAAKIETIDIKRSLVIPDLPLPKLKNPFSTQHALNAIALLKTTFGR